MPNDNLYITGSGSLEQSRTRRGIPDPMIKISGILIIKECTNWSTMQGAGCLTTLSFPG